MRWTAVAVILLILSSGCLGEKTVIKADIKITEQEGKPVIESMNVTSAQVSKAEDYKEVPFHLPGICMRTIWNSRKIDYWRCIEYKGSGEYEIISELISIPNKGDSVDVIISVYDINADELTARRVTQPWK
jgi:hypothetical protein